MSNVLDILVDNVSEGEIRDDGVGESVSIGPTGRLVELDIGSMPSVSEVGREVRSIWMGDIDCVEAAASGLELTSRFDRVVSECCCATAVALIS